MEKIAIPKNPKKAAAKPDISGGAPPTKRTKKGDNLPDQATVLFFVGRLKNAQTGIDAAQAVMKRTRKQAINAGIVMEDLKAEMAFAELSPEDLADKLARRARYAEYLGNPLGHQFTLFKPGTAILSHADQQERAYQSGFARGVMGENLDNDAYPGNSEYYASHVKGWEAGQKVLLDKIERLEPAKAAAASAPAPADDGAPERPEPDFVE
jgi:hypothetical protein